MSNTIKTGDTVTVHYTGTTTDGTVFDSSKQEGREPITVVLGEGQLIPGFEAGIIGKNEGETVNVTIEKEDAYGDRDETLVVEVPKNRLPENIEVGATLQMMTPGGPIYGTATQINEDTVTMDHNHPLAGKTISFEIEILEVISAPVVVE